MAGEKPAARATGYVITGIKKDLKELEDYELQMQSFNKEKN